LSDEFIKVWEGKRRKRFFAARVVNAVKNVVRKLRVKLNGRTRFSRKTENPTGNVVAKSRSLDKWVDKPVWDEYGRPIGRIVCFTVSPDGSASKVLVKRGDGKFQSCSVDQLRMDSNRPVLLSEVKLRVEALCDRICMARSKNQALRGLLKGKKLPPESLSRLFKDFEREFNDLSWDVQILMDEIDERIAFCTKQIQELRSALVCLEIEREIGRINERPYWESVKMVKEGLKWKGAEKADLERLREKLSKVTVESMLLPLPKPQRDRVTGQPARVGSS